MVVLEHLDGLDLHGGKRRQAPAQAGAQQRAPIARRRQTLEQPGDEIAQQECAHDVDDERRPRPAAGSGAANVSRPARASVPTAPPTKTAANSRRSKLNTSQSNAVKLPDPRTARITEEQNREHGRQPPRRQAGATRRSHRCGPGGHGVLHRRTRPGQHRPAGGLRYLRSPRIEPGRGVQRAAHPGHHAGHRGVPEGAGDVRSAVHRPRHPCAVGTGVGVGAGGVGRQRRGGDDRLGRPLHADARRQPRHPVVQPRPRG